MSKTLKKLYISVAQIAAAIVVVLLLWWMFSAIADNDLVLPDPWAVLKLTAQLLGKGATYLALLLTLARALSAFVASMAVALGLSLLVGVFDCCATVVNGFVTFVRALPTIAVILVTMIVFSSSFFVPVAVAFLVGFPVVYSAFQREISTDRKLLDVCKVYDVAKGKKVKHVLLPFIGRAVLPQCKDTFSLCVKVVIAGEVLALPRLGLGRDMYVGKVNLQTANVLALTLLALAVCYVVTGVCALIGRRK